MFEFAYTCRLYAQFAGYDRPLEELQRAVGSLLDPMHPEHRTALFKWLLR